MGSLPLKPKSVLLELASDIVGNAQALVDALAASDLAEPSFDAGGPAHVVPVGAPQQVHDAWTAVADGSLKLFQLVTGPSEVLPNFQASYQAMFALNWLLHFDVLKIIPLGNGEGMAYADVAAKAKVPESQLKSVARMAMTNHILRETTTTTTGSGSGHGGGESCRQLAHTAASAIFVQNANMADWAAFMFQASIPTAASMAKATEKWPGSVQKNETAFNVAFGHDLPFFTHLSQSPTLSNQFSGYMRSVTDAKGTDLTHMIEGYDWAGLPEHALVVDVGGSSGHASFALAKSFPNLRLEVQDLEPQTIKGIDFLKTEPPHVAGRVSFRQHDFFQAQPVHNAHTYILRMIIHDWPDVEAVKILSHIAAAMGPESTLLIMDTVLPDPGDVPLVKERMLRVRDLTMGQVFNAKERSKDDWAGLLASTRPVLRVVDVQQPAGSHMSLLRVRCEN